MLTWACYYIVQTNNQRIDKQVKRRFTNLIRSMIVEFGNRDPQDYQEPNIVEVSFCVP
jgi:hypothetical protein